MKSAVMLGINNEVTREPNDFYATDPKAVKIFLNKYLNEDKNYINKNVWECACGQGHISEVLQEYGFNVRSTDLIDRGYGEVRDFLKNTAMPENIDIITNPPFKLAEKFLEKAMNCVESGNKVILFLKIQFLEGQKRKILLDKYPPLYVYTFSERQRTALNGEFWKYKSAAPSFYAWFVWEKGYNGDTIIKRI